MLSHAKRTPDNQQEVPLISNTGLAADVSHALLHTEAPNLVSDILREPEVAIRADGDTVRSTGFGGGRECSGDAAAGRESHNAAADEQPPPEADLRGARG